MNKGITVFGIICAFALLTACASTGGGSGYGLYDAIEQSAEQIAGNLPSGSRVAIVAFESEHDNLSDYIMEELTGALFDRNIEVADRQNLEYVYKELNFQMSGDVSDETAKSIGKFLAADMVITGQMLNLDSVFRYRTSAINVETAVRASVTRLDVRADNATQRMFAALANQQTTTKVAKYGVSADVTPQTAGTFLDRGFMFFSQFGNEQLAIADFTEAIRLDPNMGQAYYGRGMTYMRMNNLARTIEDMTQAIRLGYTIANVYHNRGISYLGMEDYDKSIEDLTQAIRLWDNNDGRAKAIHDLGLAYASKGDIERAIADYSEAIRLGHSEPSILTSWYFNRGYEYAYGKQDYDRAIADLTQAIRIDPNNTEAYYQRGMMYGLKRDPEYRSIADFEAMLRIDPNNKKAGEVRMYIDMMRRERGW